MHKQRMKLTFIYSLLFLFNSLLIYSQDLIKNPDFSEVTIIYSNGKVVLPTNWDSFDKLLSPYYFSHPAKYPNKNIFAKPSSLPKYNGIIEINLLHHSNGFFTELKRTLEAGKPYTIEIELRINKILLNCDYDSNQYKLTGERIDSTDLDYNYVISLVTYFSKINPDSLDCNGRKFVIFDLPKNITPDSTEKWYKLSKTLIADGNEKYYSLGTNHTQDYIQILRTYKNDTVDYNHKWARYLVRKVSIVPIHKNREFTISDTFEPDSVLYKNDFNMRFVVRNINFDLDSYDLNDVAIGETKKVAEFLKNNENLNLKLIGHTDTIGTNQYNQELSLNRALAIYNCLINQGIDKERLNCEGKGESEPLKELLYKENFDKNRRVEFEFIKY